MIGKHRQTGTPSVWYQCAGCELACMMQQSAAMAEPVGCTNGRGPAAWIRMPEAIA